MSRPPAQSFAPSARCAETWWVASSTVHSASLKVPSDCFSGYCVVFQFWLPKASTSQRPRPIRSFASLTNLQGFDVLDNQLNGSIPFVGGLAFGCEGLLVEPNKSSAASSALWCSRAGDLSLSRLISTTSFVTPPSSRLAASIPGSRTTSSSSEVGEILIGEPYRNRIPAAERGCGAAHHG